MTQSSASPKPIQRRITLMRHGKAMPDNEGDDFARSLTESGRHAAAEAGEWLQENGLLPQLVLCSSAQRTRETLEALPSNLPAILSQSLYLASAGELLVQLQAVDDAVEHVLLVGHNPGIHGLAALLAQDFVREADADAMVGRFPTSGMVSMTVDLTHWQALAVQSATVDLLRFGSHD